MTNDRIIIREINGGEVNILDAEYDTVKINKTGVFLCKEGEVDIIIDEQEFHLCRNSIIVYFSYSELHILGHSLNLQGTLIGADLDIIQPLLYQVTNFNALFIIKKYPHQIVSESQRNTLCSYMELLERAERLSEEQKMAEKWVDDPKPVKQIARKQAELLANCLILEIVQCYTDVEFDPTPASRTDEVLQSFVSLLYRKFRSEHEVSYYADQQCLTRRYFSSIIKSKTGKSPSQWITTALLVEAKRMLLSSNISVRQISEDLFFPNQSYFGKWFKTNTGIGPLEYRHGKEEKITDDAEFDDVVRRGISFVGK